MKQSRREFMKKCGFISAGLVYGGGSLMLVGCASVSYLPYNEENNLLVIKKSNFLTRDPRMKERQKPGQKGARKKFQWVKR